MSQRPKMAGAHLRFLSMKHAQEYCYSPGWDACASQGYAPVVCCRSVSSHLYTWVKTDKVG